MGRASVVEMDALLQGLLRWQKELWPSQLGEITTSCKCRQDHIKLAGSPRCWPLFLCHNTSLWVPVNVRTFTHTHMHTHTHTHQFLHSEEAPGQSLSQCTDEPSTGRDRHKSTKSEKLRQQGRISFRLPETTGRNAVPNHFCPLSCLLGCGWSRRQRLWSRSCLLHFEFVLPSAKSCTGAPHHHTSLIAQSWQRTWPPPHIRC